jgi:hypothetical protein
VIALHAPPPPGWTQAAVEPPDLSQSPQVSQEQWEAWGPAGTTDTRLVVGCFRGETSTWSTEADGVALDKVADVASSTALRVAGVGAMQRIGSARASNVLRGKLEGSGEADGRIVASTFLAFQGETAHGCFALCVDRGGACRASVEASQLEGEFTPPPPTSAVLRAVLTLVRHPEATAWCVVGITAALGAAAIATRKRPRAR